jgi:hypothetical protein
MQNLGSKWQGYLGTGGAGGAGVMGANNELAGMVASTISKTLAGTMSKQRGKEQQVASGYENEMRNILKTLEANAGHPELQKLVKNEYDGGGGPDIGELIGMVKQQLSGRNLDAGQMDKFNKAMESINNLASVKGAGSEVDYKAFKDIGTLGTQIGGMQQAKASSESYESKANALNTAAMDISATQRAIPQAPKIPTAPTAPTAPSEGA